MNGRADDSFAKKLSRHALESEILRMLCCVTVGIFRRGLAWWIGISLICQIGIVSATPLLLAGADLCTCPDSIPGAACPMHHAQQASGDCVLKSAAPVPAAILASLLSTIGVIPRIEVGTPAGLVIELVSSPASALLSCSGSPEAPPPRA